MFCQEDLVGKEAYVFFSKTLEGDNFLLSEIIENDKPIFINFFATWCSPCIEELPLLSDFYLKNKNSLEMIIIDVNNLSVIENNLPIKLAEDPFIAQKILAKNNISFTSLFDKYAFIARQYGVTNLPHSVLIKDGIIVWEGKKKLTNISLNNLKLLINND
jgi:thiol-disulfide isomerase/thioredoxin